MKRIISILLVGVLCASMFVSVSAQKEGNLPDDLVTIAGTLQDMDIIDEMTLSVENCNREVTRGELVYYLLKLVHMQNYIHAGSFSDLPANHTYHNAVIEGHSIGMIDADNGKIRPDDFITYAEAIKAAIVLIGVDSEIDDINYYMSLAKSKGIIKKVGYANALFTFAETLELLYNTLQAETINLLSPDGNRYESVSILENCWGLTVGTGFVTANRHYSLNGVVGFDSNQLIINGRAYLAGDGVDVDCVGLRVKYFYDDNGKITVLEKEEHKKLTVSSKDMISLSDGSFKYYDDSDRQKTAKIADNAYILENYDVILSDSAAIPQNGDVTLLDYDNNGSYDVVFVNDYTEAVASYIDKDSEIISCKGGKTMEYEAEHILVYIDGIVSTVDNIKAGNTLSVVCGANGVADVVCVSTKTIQGAITSMSTGYVSIRGREYEISTGIDPRINMKVGDSGTFYINHKGAVAYYVSQSTSLQFGYLMDIGIKNGISDEVSVRILTENNDKTILSLKETITYNGVKTAAAAVVSVLQSSGHEGSCEQIVRYSVNKDGIITKLETAASNDSGITTYSDRLHLAAEKSAISGILDAVTTVGKDTVEFIVPESAGGDDELYRAVAAPERSTNRTFKVYNLRKYQYSASVIVHYASISEELDYEELPAVVSEVVMALNDEGETRKRVTLMQSTGWPSTIKKFTYFVSESPVWSTVNGSEATTPQLGDNLNVGDVISYAVDAKNEIVRIDRMYNGQTKSIDSHYGSVTEITNSGTHDSKLRLRVSHPFMSEGKFLIASKVPITSLTPSEDDLEYYEHYFDDVLIVERGRGGITMRKGTMSDIRTYENYGDTCDKLLLQTSWSWLYNVIAIRNDV